MASVLTFFHKPQIVPINGKLKAMKKIITLVVLMITGLGVSAQTVDWKFTAPFETFEGKPVDLGQVIGKQPVYMKFWASWCLECRQEFPDLEQDYQRLVKGNNPGKLAMFAVNLNLNEELAYIDRLVKQHNMSIPVLFDNNGNIASHFSFQGTPFHVLINAQGEVVYTSYHHDETLIKLMDQLAAGENVKPVTSSLTESLASPTKKNNREDGIFFFTTTWCVDYMKDVQPELSEHCQQALDFIQQLHKQNPSVAVKVYVTHLWTAEADAKQFAETTKIPYPVILDSNNQQFQRYKVSQYPTLLVVEEGKDVERIENFENAKAVAQKLEKYLAN